MRAIQRIWHRLLSVPLLTLALSACVTTQGGGSTDSFPQFRLSGLTDFFSSEVREFRKLMNEGKSEQALAYFKEKEAYFGERYAKDDGQVPPEFTQLAEQVLTREWQPSLLTARTALINPSGLSDPKARADARAAWKDASERLAAVEGAALYKITRVGRGEVAQLTQMREKFKARAAEQKAEVLPTLLDEVLTGSESSVPYVGDLRFDAADFQGATGFQAAAWARLNAASKHEELEKMAHRLFSFLTNEMKVKIDRRYAELVRQAFLADGRISPDELAQLSRMVTPTGAAPDAIKNIVKLGLAQTVRKSGSRGFAVTFNKDLALDLENAADALLKYRNASAYDFVYLTSVADAIPQRQPGAERPLLSRYRAGTDRERNPDYAQARERVTAAERTFNQAKYNADSFRCAQGVSASFCRNAMIITSAAVVTASNSLSEARRNLASTPETVEKPRMASYQYWVTPYTVAKEVRGVAVLWDVKGKQAWLMPLEHKVQRSFELVAGVHADDPDRASLLNRADKERDIDLFALERIELALSNLFSASRLVSARTVPAPDANAVLALLDDEYARAAPKDDPPSVGKVFRLPQ